MAIETVQNSENGSWTSLKYTSDDALESINSDELDNADPKLRMQKMLLDAMFDTNPDQHEKNNSAIPISNNKVENDAVQLSAESMELYQGELNRIVVQNGAERIDIQFEHVQAIRTERQEMQQKDPLVIDLNANGIELTDVSRGNGVRFDITGDGAKETTSWVAATDGFLAYDRNSNGAIDNGSELFGDQNGAVDGFAELAKYDDDSNGMIDSHDAIYAKLNVWRDLDQNGASETGELNPLSYYKINSIDLHAHVSNEKNAGNTIAAYSTYQGATGSGRIGEVFANFFA
jgi:hypothetical protein